MRPAEEFRHAIADAGLTAPDEIVPDGTWHRFASNGDREDDAGWYRFFPDGVPAGSFGCFRSGITQKWCSKSDRQLSETERAEYRRRIEETRRQRDHEVQRRHAEAQTRANTIWDAAGAAQADHPYLQRKQIQPHNLRVTDNGRHIVPVVIDGVITSVEFIWPDGEKKFLPGGTVKGGVFILGDLTEATTIILLAEGFATGASVHEATGNPVVVAFMVSNVISVAEQVRQQFPTATIVVCGDNDVRENGTPNVGLEAATVAANAVNGLLAIPDAIHNRATDWNDVHVQHGLDAVKMAMAAVVRRQERETINTTTAEAIEAVVSPHPHVLDEVHAFLGRFVAYPSEHAHIAHTLWVAHTHLMDAWESTPRLAFLSPEPGSGKTRAMELTETLVPRPVEAVNVTSAYLFRKISDSDGLPTVLHDEIDTVFGPRAKDHEEIRGAINAGHRRGASAWRCVVKGKQIETEELPAFCAVAIAGLGNLPDTILSRSVIIRMRRRGPSEEVQPYRRRVHAPEGYQLRNRLAAWATQIRPMLDTYPPMPDGITDRNADVWESLLSVADAAGGSWPERARVAARPIPDPPT